MTQSTQAPEPGSPPPAPKPRYTGSPINRGIGRSTHTSRFSGRRGLAVLGCVVAVLGAFAWVGLHDNADAKQAPDVGSCVQVKGSASAPKPHEVDCSDSAAEYTVLSKVIDGNQTTCQGVSGSTASFVATEVDKPEHTQHPAYVLCLGAR